MSQQMTTTSTHQGGPHTETRWIGVKRCPNDETLTHVLPITISGSMRLRDLQTPGNITAAEPCPACIEEGRRP